MKYALIKQGKVDNIIVLGQKNAGDFPDAIEVEGISVAIGDTFSDGVFYRNGERVLTDAELAALPPEEPTEEPEPQIEP